MTRPEEHLAELLDARDAEIEELTERLRIANIQLEHGTGWLRHTKIEDDGKLPIPRLEIVYRSEDHGCWIATYRLVKRHLRGELLAIPLGETRMSGYGDKSPNEAPFREGCHIAFDTDHLRLPAFLHLPGKEPEALDLSVYTTQTALGRDARRP